jgi:hypothetical protein
MDATEKLTQGSKKKRQRKYRTEERKLKEVFRNKSGRK